MPKIRISYLFKLLMVLIGLVVALEIISYTTTRIVIYQAVTKNARAELMAGGELFSRLMQKNVEQLALSVKVLTEDFGFKDAVASNDEKTIRSALINHAARVKADLGVLISMDNRIIVSDEQAGLLIQEEFKQLKARAEQRGQAYDTVIINNKAYQFVMFSVRAPVTIGIAGMGFEIKKDFSDELKRLTDLEVSFISYQQQQPVYLTGTLEQATRMDLLSQLIKNPTTGEVFEYDSAMSLTVPVIGQQNQLVAVLQVPLSKVLEPFARLNIQLFVLALVFAIFAAVVASLLARSVTLPVTLLGNIAQRIAKGFYNTPIAIKSQDELGDLANAFTHMQAAISEREQQVIYQSEHDPLTGLPNRLRIFPELQLAISNLNNQEKLYLLIVDIKNFTQVNDELSQEIGDALLKEVAHKLANMMQQASVLRLGSDEFLLLHSAQDVSLTTGIAEKIHALFKLPFILSGIQLNIDVNIGVAVYPQDADSAESLLRRANLALNEGRAKGISSCYYQHGWDEKHLRRLHIFREFEQSLAEGHLSVYYQPKIDLKHVRSLGAEALIRWNHPELGFISPDEFIGLIESSGQITLLTRWVIKTALLQLKHLLADNLDIRLSVNLSAVDLLVDDLPDYIIYLLNTYHIPAEKLCLEVTESAVMREANKSLDNLYRLQAVGLVLSIDDFGTGYSSLSQLKKLPVSELKIDKSFILNLDANPDDQLIVRSTIDLGHTLGLSVTAEGVETEAIKERLQAYGCDTAQGYLYSKPLPAEAFNQWIRDYLAGLES